MHMLSYYTVFCTILALIWILIFTTKPALRPELVITSILSLFLLPVWIATQAIEQGTTQELFTSLSLLDLICLFSLCGISTVIFHIFFGKHYTNMPKPKKGKESLLTHSWLLGIFFALLGFVWITILIHTLFSLPTPPALLIAAIMVSIYIVSHRHDLLGDALWSAILTALLVFIVSILASAFTSTSPALPFMASGKIFLGAPLDLLYWSLALGLVLGPLYEFMRRKYL